MSLDPGAVTVDVVAFERQVAEGTPLALADAAALYRGDLLEGLTVQEPPFEDWLLAQCERLHEVAHRASGMLHLAKGDWATARKLSQYGFTAFRSGNVAIQSQRARCLRLCLGAAR